MRGVGWDRSGIAGVDPVTGADSVRFKGGGERSLRSGVGRDGVGCAMGERERGGVLDLPLSRETLRGMCP